MRDERHLNHDYKYGHPSQLVHPVDLEKYPLFAQAKPVHFELKAGDYVYIPGGWWHWIASHEDRCVSVNYWFEDTSLGPSPFQKTFDPSGIDWSDDRMEGMFGSNTLAVWDTRQDLMHFMPFRVFRRDAKQNKYYLTTVKGYDTNYCNKIIADGLAPDIETIRTRVGGPQDSISNVWYNYGDVDTRLHYDDYASIVGVLEGTKTVDLYSPDQSAFLYPSVKT